MFVFSGLGAFLIHVVAIRIARRAVIFEAALIPARLMLSETLAQDGTDVLGLRVVDAMDMDADGC